jgi:hypothetical protein
MSAHCRRTGVRSPQHYISGSSPSQCCADHTLIVLLTATLVMSQWSTHCQRRRQHVSALSQNWCAIATALHLWTVTITVLCRSHTDCVWLDGCVPPHTAVHSMSTHSRGTAALSSQHSISQHICNTAMFRKHTDCALNIHQRPSTCGDSAHVRRLPVQPNAELCSTYLGHWRSPQSSDMLITH